MHNTTPRTTRTIPATDAARVARYIAESRRLARMAAYYADIARGVTARREVQS
jgi:hypothetical protein